MKDKIREAIEMMDSLVKYPHGAEHCILPEHYDQLAEDIVKLLAAPAVSVNEVAVCLKPEHVICCLMQNGLCTEDVSDCEFRQTER